MIRLGFGEAVSKSPRAFRCRASLHKGLQTIQTSHCGEATGNERVLRARLADARFFWDQDRRVPLARRVEVLSERVFHARLGSLADKVARMERLAEFLADYVPGADRERSRRAVQLAKADLSTGMVGEFPELQGVIGRYYALHDGEDSRIADAVAEHYKPVGPSDTCPTVHEDREFSFFLC